MMLIDTIAPGFESSESFEAEPILVHRGRITSGRAQPVRTRAARPVRSRPAVAPLQYRGTGVLMSRTPHRPQSVRAITPGTTVVLALVAAAITVWLGMIVQFGAPVAAGDSAVPDRLGVVRVHNGESLQHLATRVAPDAPTGQVVERIRELNALDSVVLVAGQTLIAPLG
ncbi:LysM peptidoglycan-binding domain-containing protein [[Mycobacterium] kokjensenii]|uniref:LysM peptidoglycan-binding domain-containing protein n=1 Tax=[Mycobacterium] kokjensenii TaxID=3064287 RepID=A0ABM9LJA8_9MYCO|nr:LysM peptidoglycan-binding domain-containing protein [Mycolicibacter sp. MU0083]CAJ1499904.1 LysM peptidoglycan-binding domain-containing protein [Mycolicibacter sp. MU0083]